MPFTIQHVSPHYALFCLLSQPNGAFILRYPTENDELISRIRFDPHSKEELSTDHYIILSIRVDETIYKYHIQHYRLPYTEEDRQGDNKQVLERYNRERKNVKNDKFTPLKHELILPPENNSWTFDKRRLQDVEFVKTAGVHNEGTSKANWQFEKQNDIKIFIKRFNKNNWYFMHELALLRQLCHFTIITLYGHYSDNKYSYLVFEDGGKSLESCCPLRYRSSKMKMRFIANIGFQVSQAMIYLEKKNIIHRDLTAGNVLINCYGFIKVADFGHAIKKEQGINSLERSQSKSGAQNFQFRFLAPECLPDVRLRETSNNSDRPDIYARFSSKSDVWSFGILLIQLMIDDPRKPYRDISDDDIPKHVKKERHIHPRPNECSTDMYLILERCWAYEPKERISFTELREKMFTLEAILR
jgi:hypothetical protein